MRRWNYWLGAAIGSVVYGISPTIAATIASPASNFKSVAANTQLAQAPAKEFELQDFDYWAEQCRSLTTEKLYQEALTACEKAIPLNTEKDKKRRQQQTLDLWKNRSLALFHLGRYQDAIGSYTYVLSIQPADSMALTYRCESLFRLGRNESAIASCEQALQVDGDWGEATPAQALSVRALAQKQAGQLEEAIVSFDQAIAASPEDLTLQAERCNTVVALKQRQQAALDKARTETAASANPGAGEAASTQIPDLEAALADSTQESETCLQSLQNPEKPADGEAVKPSAYVLYQQGLILKNQERLTEAKATFEQAVIAYEQELATNSTEPQGWIYQGLVLEKLNQDARALTSYQQALQLRPNLSFAFAQQCGVLNRLKRFQEALVACDSAFKGDGLWGESSPAYVWSQRSRSLVGLKQYEDAVAAADRAIALNGNDAEAHYYKAFALWYLKDLVTAQELVNRAIALKPDYAQAYALRGKISSTQKDLSRAVEDYTKALTLYNCTTPIEPTSLPAFCTEVGTNLATALLRRGEFEQAFNYARQAAEASPDSFDLQYNYGLTALKFQKYEEALTAFQQADILKPNSIAAITGLGIALKELGRIKEAMIAINHALSINPNYALARSTYNELERLQKQQEAELRKRWMQQIRQRILQQTR